MKRCSTTEYKDKLIQDCEFYLHSSETPQGQIEMALLSMNENVIEGNTYLTGYRDGLKQALAFIKTGNHALIRYVSKRSK